MLFLGDETLGRAFFSGRHRALEVEELLIHFPAPLGMRVEGRVELFEAGPLILTAAVGEAAAVTRLLRTSWIDANTSGVAGLRVVPGALVRRRSAVAPMPTCTFGHGSVRKGQKRTESLAEEAKGDGEGGEGYAGS